MSIEEDALIQQANAWGELKGKTFTPLYTDEEWQFRQAALVKIISGELDDNETLALQRECVRRREASPYSWARKLT